MPFIADGRSLITRAFTERLALPAFNVCSAEMIRACLEAAETENAPVILQTYPTDLAQLPPKETVALVRAFAEDLTVPVMLHLDHGPSLDLAYRCLRAGFSSVMFDGAGLPLETVIKAARTLGEVAHAQGAALEVAAESFSGSAELTDPDAALRLRNETGADMIAVAVGSEHGHDASLDKALLKTIAERLASPLVLHGGSGVDAEDLRVARNCGVVKVNIGSALYRTLRRTWEASASAPNHRAVYSAARDALVTVARQKIRALNT